MNKMTKISFTILGEPASKANSREIVTIKRRNKKTGQSVNMPASIKSEKARNYANSALLQIPVKAKAMLDGPVRLTARIYYASERPDLDESVILDVLQAKLSKVEKGKPREVIRRGVYVNDRQVKEKHIFHGIDKNNPRAEIEIEPIEVSA